MCANKLVFPPSWAALPAPIIRIINKAPHSDDDDDDDEETAPS
jgi:hypothetical protein